MAVLPHAYLFFPCAGATEDESNNSVTIVDPLYAVELNVREAGSHESGVLFFYAHLVGGLSTFHCRIEGFDEDGHLVARSTPRTIQFSAENRFTGVPFTVELPSFGAVQAGIYEFGLFLNYLEEPTGICSIRFLERGP